VPTPKFDLQTLADRAAIEDVVVRYFYAYDAGDLDLLATCFTDDATAEFGGVKVDGGGRGISAFLRGAGGPRVVTNASHYVSNVRIELEGDVATVDCYAISCRSDPAGASPMQMRGLRYRDRFARGSDGGWRIADRVHTAVWQASAPGVPIAPMRAASPRERS